MVDKEMNFEESTKKCEELEIKLAEAESKIKELTADIEKYKTHYHKAIDKNTELSISLTEMTAKYNTVSQSKVWKVTKPIRVFADFIKKVFKLSLILKAFKYLMKNGFRATVGKIKEHGRNRKQLKNISTSYYISDAEREKETNTKFNKDIKFSVLVPLYNTPERFLLEMVHSVRNQTYKNWELCLADGSDNEHDNVKQLCEKLVSEDERIIYKKLEKNLGISENTNACIDMSTGNYIALFDHDDILHPSALYEMMVQICDKDADYIYTDEATFKSPNLKDIITVHYKPEYAVDNLRANNYICHFSVFSREVLEKSGKFSHEYDGSQDHDMILRLTEKAKCVVHIPKVLYYWRSHPSSVAMDINSKTYAIDAGRRAVRDSVIRSGYDAEVVSSRAFPTIYRIKYKLKNPDEKVSIIIPNKNHKKDLKKCINSILTNTIYSNFEIIILDNGSNDEDTLKYYEKLKSNEIIKIVPYDIEFNYSKINNYAVKFASGKYYIFLNNDIEIITPEWIEEMLMYAQRDDVGAVGAMLYYPDNTVQHAGVIMRLGVARIAGHAFNRVPRTSVGYMGRMCYAQDMSAVTAACMMVKASVFEEVGGFEEELKVAYNDVDFCLKIRQAGYLIVWTPHAEAYHYESKSRGTEDETEEKKERYNKEVEFFKTKWKDVLEKSDPYYNPNFSLDTSTFDLA